MAHKSIVVFLIGEVHRWIVGTCSLMKIDIESIIGAHLQRRLHRCGTNGSTGHILRYRTLHASSYLRQLGGLVAKFLSIVVSRNPPSRVVAGHCKLCEFFSHHEIGQFLLIGEFIAKTKTVIEQTETNVQVSIVLRLFQLHQQLIIMVANAALFSPNRFPSFVERIIFKLHQGEIAKEVRLTFSVFICGARRFPIKICTLLTILFFKLIPQMRRRNHRFAIHAERISRTSLVNTKRKLKLSIGGRYLLSRCTECRANQRCE